MVPARARVLRGVALELERIANHIGDLGALSGDVGFLPTQAFCGRIRGDVLNLTARFCGNRFGRGWIRPGGVVFDAEPARVQEVIRQLKQVQVDATSAIELLWESGTVLARFEGTGPVSADMAHQIGLVGPAARACGLLQDVRRDYPCGCWVESPIEVPTCTTGDVFARARIRWEEIRHSIDWVLKSLTDLSEGPVMEPDTPLINAPWHPNLLLVSMIEGWRGRICHTAITGPDGHFAAYKIVDPSFFNWFGLAYALRNQEISDFPLCNKSFNLSYCGFDL